MLVAGFLPMLLIQFGRFADAAFFASIYWAPLNNFENILFSTVLIGIPLVLIWHQWFWIAATRIGWQVKAKWWEMVLLTIASFLGMPIAGLIMTAFKPIRIAVNHFALWIGI